MFGSPTQNPQNQSSNSQFLTLILKSPNPQVLKFYNAYMGDSGEGLIDAEGRIQERAEELQREREQSKLKTVRDPERVRALESLRLARTELQRQLDATTHERRRAQILQAIQEVDRRIAEQNSQIDS